MTITPDAIVVPFLYLSDVTRPMRVVVDHARGEATVEELRGTDALGAERWHLVDMDADQNSPGHPDCTAQEWAEMVACAIDKAYRERLPSAPDPRPGPRARSARRAVDTAVAEASALGAARPLMHALQVEGFDDWADVERLARSDRHPVAIELLCRRLPSGDAPQEPSPDTDARAQGAAAGVDALLELIDHHGLMHARAELRADAICNATEGSRPPGGAEPAKREAIEQAAAVLRAHLVMHSTQWAAMDTLLDVALGCGRWRASEGAAPPPQPGGNTVTDMPISITTSFEERDPNCPFDHLGPCHHFDEPEPSGVPDGRRWWVDTGEGIDEVDSKRAAEVAAADAVTDCSMQAVGDAEWPERVEGICWGEMVVIEEASATVNADGEADYGLVSAAPEPSASGVPDALGMSLHKLYSVARTRESTSEERYGQALFNTLHEVRPDISERLRGTRDDPFHAPDGSERLMRALAVIESMWGGRCPPDADAGTLEALHGAETDLRRIAEMFGDEQGNAVELAAEHAGLRKRVEAVLSAQVDLRVGLTAASPAAASFTHGVVSGSASTLDDSIADLTAALEVKS